MHNDFLFLACQNILWKLAKTGPATLKSDKEKNMSFRHVNIYANDFLLHDKCLVIFDSLYMQVLVTLRYLSKGDFFSEVGDLHGISRPSVSRIINNGMKF